MRLTERFSKPTLQYAILWALPAWALVAELTVCSFAIYLRAASANRATEPFVTRAGTVQILHYAPGFQHSGL